MNAKQLQEIEEREQKAPIGPWKVEDDEQGYCWIRIPAHDLYFGDMETTDGCCFYMAEFIANSREDVPALVTEVRQLQTALVDMLDLIEEHGDRTMKSHASRILRARSVVGGMK